MAFFYSFHLISIFFFKFDNDFNIDLANLIEKKKFKKKVRYGRFELAG